MRNTRGRRPVAGGEDGWAELVVLAVFAAIVGFAFLWALVLHEKPAEEEGTSASTSLEWPFVIVASGSGCASAGRNLTASQRKM